MDALMIAVIHIDSNVRSISSLFFRLIMANVCIHDRERYL